MQHQDGNGNGTGMHVVDLVTQMLGNMTDVEALAARLQATHRDCRGLTIEECIQVAQKMLAVGANIYCDELRVWRDEEDGELVVTEGYRLLIRWAKRQANYSEQFRDLDGIRTGDIGVRCYLLRHDRETFDLMRMLLDSGMANTEVLDLVGTVGDGIVQEEEMVDGDGYPRRPQRSTGWTWRNVAEKRALANALRRAYGAPTMLEMARESWMVGNTITQPADWQRALDNADIYTEDVPSLALAAAEERETGMNGPFTALLERRQRDTALPVERPGGPSKMFKM